MALTVATAADQPSGKQPGTLGALKARRVIITFTSGYDSTTGVTVTGRSVGLNEIIAIIPEGPASTGAGVGSALATGNATVTLWNGTTKVATSDQSATTAAVLVLGF